MIYLLFIVISITVGSATIIEIYLDWKHVNHPETLHPKFIKYKHFWYNLHRLISWFSGSIIFFQKYPFWKAVFLSTLTLTANFFLFRFYHDGLYQHFIKKNYKKGIGFFGSSSTPKSDEQGISDQIFRDNLKNRLIFLFLAIIIYTYLITKQ